MADLQVYKDGMTHCGACENWEKQKTCTFYIKNTNLNQCRFLRFEEYCDKVKEKTYVPTYIGG
jgi:hypothetical protein